MPLLDLLVLIAAVVVVAVVVLARRRPALGAVFARQWPRALRRVLAGRPGGRGGDAVAGRQATARRALPDGQPAGGSPARGVRDRPRGVAWPAAAPLALAAVLLVVVLGLSAVGAAQWYSKGGPQDFRSAVGYIADRAQPGDGVLIFAPYERIPVEWYMDGKPATERRRASRLSGDGVGRGPADLRRGGGVQLRRHCRQAASTYQRIWLVSATADLSLYPAQAALGRRRPAPGRLHAGRHHGVPRGAR